MGCDYILKYILVVSYHILDHSTGNLRIRWIFQSCIEDSFFLSHYFVTIVNLIFNLGMLELAHIVCTAVSKLTDTRHNMLKLTS